MQLPELEFDENFGVGAPVKDKEKGEDILGAARSIAKRYELSPWHEDRTQDAAVELLQAELTFEERENSRGDFAFLSHTLSQAAGGMRNRAHELSEQAKLEICLSHLLPQGSKMNLSEWLERMEIPHRRVMINGSGNFVTKPLEGRDQAFVAKDGSYMSIEDVARTLEERYGVETLAAKEAVLDHLEANPDPFVFKKREEREESRAVPTTVTPFTTLDGGKIVRGTPKQTEIYTRSPSYHVWGDEAVTYNVSRDRQRDNDEVSLESFVWEWKKRFIDAWEKLTKRRDFLYLKYEQEGRHTQYVNSVDAFSQWYKWLRGHPVVKLRDISKKLFRDYLALGNIWGWESKRAIAWLLLNTRQAFVEAHKAEQINAKRRDIEEVAEYLAIEIDGLHRLISFIGKDTVSFGLSKHHSDKPYRWLCEILGIEPYRKVDKLPANQELLEVNYINDLKLVPVIDGMKRSEVFRVWYEHIRGSGWIQFGDSYLSWLYREYDPDEGAREMASILDAMTVYMYDFRGSEGLDYFSRRQLLTALSSEVEKKELENPFLFLYGNLGMEKAARGHEEFKYPSDKGLREKIREQVLAREMFPAQAVKLFALLDGLSPFEANARGRDVYETLKEYRETLNQRYFANENEARIASTIYPGIFAPKKNRVLVWGDASAARVDRRLHKLGADPSDTEIVGLSGTLAEEMTEHGWDFIDFSFKLGNVKDRQWAIEQAACYATRVWVYGVSHAGMYLARKAKNLGIYVKILRTR